MCVLHAHFVKSEASNRSKVSIGTPAISGKYWQNETDKKLSLGRFIFAFICSIYIFPRCLFFYLQDYFAPYFVRHVIHDSHFVLLRDGVYAACRFC